MRNLPELVVAYMATVSIAAIAVPLNGWWTGQEFEYALSDSGASVLFADQERFNRIAPFLAGLKLEGRTVLVRSFYACLF